MDWISCPSSCALTPIPASPFPPRLPDTYAAAMALLSRTKAVAGVRAAPAVSSRAVRLVVRATVQKQQQKPTFQLPAAVQPAVVAVVANALMAMPALADGGKLL